MKTKYAFFVLALVAILFTSCEKDLVEPCGCGGNGNGTGVQPPPPPTPPAPAVGHAYVWSRPADGDFGNNVVPPAVPLDLDGNVVANLNGYCSPSPGGNQLHEQIQNTYDYYRNEYKRLYGSWPAAGTTYVEVTYEIIPGAGYFGGNLYQVTGVVL